MNFNNFQKLEIALVSNPSSNIRLAIQTAPGHTLYEYAVTLLHCMFYILYYSVVNIAEAPKQTFYGCAETYRVVVYIVYA